MVQASKFVEWLGQLGTRMPVGPATLLPRRILFEMHQATQNEPKMTTLPPELAASASSLDTHTPPDEAGFSFILGVV